MSVESCTDRLLALREQEGHYSRLNLQRESFKLIRNRAKLIDWFAQIKGFMDYSPNFVSLCTSILDRSIQHQKKSWSDNELTLFAATSIFLAAKIAEEEPLSADLVVSLCHGKLTQEQLLDQENKTLNQLSWRLSPPTLAAYCQEYLSLLQANNELRVLAFEALEPMIVGVLKSPVLQKEPQPQLSFAMFQGVVEEVVATRPDLMTSALKDSFEIAVNKSLGLHARSDQTHHLKELIEYCLQNRI